jgi:hypothetical protein
LGGAAAAGVTLSLHRYDDMNDDEVATIVTGADGRYAFTGAPSLPAGAAYYVLYGPNSTDPGKVYAWYGPDLADYTADASIAAGDFDIANVVLLSPAPGATVTFPAAFSWQRRGLSGDTYQVLFNDPNTDDWWRTPDLGDVGSYTMPGLSQGMAYREVYYWLIRVFRGADSYGYSYYMRSVTFQAGSEAAEPAEADLIPVSGLGIRLPAEGGDHPVE